MTNGYSRSPKLLKGALIEFSERLVGSLPNIIVFQYNPDAFTRTLTVWTPPGSVEGEGETPGTASDASSRVQPADPPESFKLELELDATDDLEAGDPIAERFGVADRIAALEMLLYPEEGTLVENLVQGLAESLGAQIGSAISGATPIPRRRVPVVLFVWGPGRIVPVRLTTFKVEEQAFSPTLYPIHAKVTIDLKLLTPHDFPEPRTPTEELAVAAFNFTRKQKQILAAANVENSVESILGMLPF